MINYSKQSIDTKDINQVIKILKSDYLTTGPIVPKFEKKICDITKSKFSVSVNSGTSALHISCMALGLKKNDIVWTSPNSFVASANCALYCGAKVDFIDIGEDLNIDIKLLEAKLKIAKKKKKLPKILIPVHFSGQSCDMKKIKRLSVLYNFKIIEDASHALGARYLNNPVGNCKYSDITVFSTHPVKIITTIEGGIATTNDLNLYSKLSALRNHGIYRKKHNKNSYKNIRSHFDQVLLGYNYRMSDVQAGLGLSQLKKIKRFISLRQNIRKVYDQKLKINEISIPKSNKNTYSTYHLYVIRVKKGKRDKLLRVLKKNKIFSAIHYIPIHFHPYYQKIGFKRGDFPQVEKYYRECISLPIHPSLKKKQIYFTIKIIKKFFNQKLND